MIRNHEQSVYQVISDEDYKNDWNLLSTYDVARGMGFPWHVDNWRRRTRKGPELACVQSPTAQCGTRGEGRAN